MTQSLKIDKNLDQHLKVLKSKEGELSSLEIATEGNGARISGNLEATGYTDNIRLREEARVKADGNVTLDSAGDITLDSDGGEVYLKDGGTEYGYLSSSGSSTSFRLYEAAGASTDDYFLISVAAEGVTSLTTVDGSGEDANLVIKADGDLTFNSATGVFKAVKGLVEFSAADSAYAGMILGYTRIQNDATTTGHNIISVSTSMTVLQTATGTECKVSFVAPPSGNVEIQFHAAFTTQDTYYLSLSTASSYAEHDESHTYDAACIKNDETDVSLHTVSFSVTGLTAGTSYERWIAAKVSGGTGDIQHGRNRTSGTHAPPIIIKAIALPATITTGE